MKLQDIKSLVTAAEPRLADQPFVVIHRFEEDERAVRLALTERLRKASRRGRVWKSTAFLTALRNAQYGFDETRAHSPGGSDGIFLLTRSFKPQNEMMRKVFDRFLDRPGSGAEDIAKALGASLESLIPVRLVSHHLRLLGVLHRGATGDTLVLVDYDDTGKR